MHFLSGSVVVPFLLALSASPTTALPSNVDTRDTYKRTVLVPGVGIFTRSAVYTFGGNTLPQGLFASDQQLITDQANGAPYNHVFEAKNVFVKDGYLNIKVPGGQKPSTAPNQAVSSGEVFTGEQNILYASVRTRLIFSGEPGTCQSAFFYKSDTQESDIEYLSDPTSNSNNGKAQIHYSNQPTNGGDETTVAMSVPADANRREHEYRLDWTSSFTAFYIDGRLQQKFTDNVPTQPGSWLWNNWSNGDKGWPVGPPAKDSVLKIRSIVMYYNTTSSA